MVAKNDDQREVFLRSLLVPLRASDAEIADIMLQAPASTATSTAKAIDAERDPTTPTGGSASAMA